MIEGANTYQRRSSESFERPIGCEKAGQRLHAPNQLSDDLANGRGNSDPCRDDRIGRHAYGLHAGRQVRHQRQTEDLSSHLSSSDGFQRARHTYQIGAQCAEHSDLCRSLELRPVDLGIHPFGERGLDGSGQLPEPWRPNIHKIHELARIAIPGRKTRQR